MSTTRRGAAVSGWSRRLGRASTITGATGGVREQSGAPGTPAAGLHRGVPGPVGQSGGVALGRGGMVVLRTVPSALHVHLGGPRDARITQGMAIDGVDRATAERRQEAEDKREDRVRPPRLRRRRRRSGPVSPDARLDGAGPRRVRRSDRRREPGTHPRPASRRP